MVTDFESMKLKINSADIVNAMYSLHFVNSDVYFNVWEKIVRTIKSGGYFVGNFIGEKDSWNNPEFKFTILNESKIHKMFADFEIIYFKEIEKDAKTVLGNDKHWHIYNIIAKKN